MDLFKNAKDAVTGALAGMQVGGEALKSFVDDLEQAHIDKESAELGSVETFGEEASWRELNGFGRWNFTRTAIRKFVAWSRVMYIINPLIKRAVTVQELYVWGSGCQIKAESELVQEVLDDCFLHPKNQKAIGTSWPDRERDQRNDGNCFFVWFVNKITGACRVRYLPVDYIDDIICNPEDCTEIWLYKKTYVQDTVAAEMFPDLGNYGSDPVYYPDIDWNPRAQLATFQGVRIDWNVRVQHVKSGGLSHMKFGIPELFSTFNWATGYKGILENFATILRAYARLAMKMTGLSGKKGAAAAKSKLNTGLTSGALIDKNPSPNTGSMALLYGGADISAVKTAGHTTGPDEARALRSMVAAGSDTPEHFFGDSDIGNFATSATLDRPTELKMISRQTMWANVILRMCQNIIQASAKAPQGKLRNAGYTLERIVDDFDGATTFKVIAPNGESTGVTVTFPAILERDVVERVRAVVQAATLNGSTAEGIIPDRKFLFQLLMEALGKKDAEMLVNKYYPQSILQGFRDPAKMQDDDHLKAVGDKELGDAALLAAKNKPGQPPKLGGSGATSASSR